ncbi:MAG: ketopantoate reductase family protein [Burkholderiaceae bacterium]
MEPESIKTVAVMGAGAVGSYFGAMLARAGVDVTLIGRAAHVAAIASHGLWFESLRFAGPVAIKASVDAAAVAGADLVLLAVKSGDTDSAAQAIAPHLGPGAVVLSLQNGIDNVERLRRHLTQPVLPALVYVAAALPAPGHLRHTGRGDLVIGDTAKPLQRLEASRLDAIARVFETSAVPCRISAEIEIELWTKLAINCAYNAISALGSSNYGRMVASPDVVALMHAATREVVAVARASGVLLDEDAMIATVDSLAPAMPQQISSTAQDIARARATEIDHLNGYVTRRGEAQGVAVPVNRTLWTLVSLLEG